jgi:O-Antigen ligase
MSGGLIASALVIGPLNYGSTRSAGIALLVGLLGAAALCWSVGLATERRVPSTPAALLIGLGALAGSSLFWLSGISQPTSPAEFTRTHFARVIARWPHSVINLDPGTTIALHAGLGLALWMVADLSRDRTWAMIFSSVMVATGVLVTLLAFSQNFTHATGIYWRGEGRMPGRFWGTFFHHTSAGAYLNTIWPIAAGLALSLSRRSVASIKSAQGATAVAALALVLLLGAHASHISRFPQLAVIGVLPFLIWALFSNRNLRFGRWALAVSIGILAVILCTGRTSEIMQRWRLFDFSSPKTARVVPPENEWPQLVRTDLLIPNLYNSGKWSDRGEAQRTALRAIDARPVSGHGPGNWLGAASQHSSDPYFRSFYLYLQFAHEDFLQTWVEWGLAGFIALLLLLPGAVIASCWFSHKCEPAVATLACCAAAGLAAVLLQSLLDFPLQIPGVALNACVLAGLCWSTLGSSAPTAVPAISTVT